MKAASVRNNADSIGVGLPVVLIWAMQTYSGVELPMEVAVAAAGIIASFGAKVRKAF